MPNVSVVGAGSFGIALALHLQRRGHDVVLVAKDKKAADHLQAHRCSPYLPDAFLPSSIAIESTLRPTSHVLVATPSFAFEDVMKRIQGEAPLASVVWGTKGLCGGRPLYAIASEVLKQPFGVLSGPSFAQEVAEGAITALVLASSDNRLRADWCTILHDERLRIYESKDTIGVCWGGVLKNIYALAVGIAAGLGLKNNAKAALLTRALAEMIRIGSFFGAAPQSFMGLAGLGDLMLSSSEGSRNFRCGVKIGQGQSKEAARVAIDGVVEGLMNLKEVWHLVHQHLKGNMESLPLLDAAFSLIEEGMAPEDVLYRLMLRPIVSEIELP